MLGNAFGDARNLLDGVVLVDAGAPELLVVVDGPSSAFGSWELASIASMSA